MNLRELYYENTVNLVPLKDKTRLTKKSMGYALFDEWGIITYPESWRSIAGHISDYGILCDFVPELNKYYSVLDIDTKEFPIMEVLEQFPTTLTKTKHGYHLHFLSENPCTLKQLTGTEKEICPVDIRAKRSTDPEKEGNYIRLSPMIGDTTELLEIDFNKVVEYVYNLFGIAAKQRTEYKQDIEEWTGSYGRFRMSRLTHYDYYLACYLYYQKQDWKTAYDVAFQWGTMLKGTIRTEESAFLVSNAIMRLSRYPRPNKWIRAFMTGYANAEDGKAIFNSLSLPDHVERLLETIVLDKLSFKEIKKLAEISKDYNLQDILNAMDP